MLDNGLPERIVSGREDTWIAGFVDWLEVVKGAVDPDAVAEYAAHLRRPGHLGASYAYFRTFHGDAEATIRHRETPLAMPVLAIGGEGALGKAIPDQMQLYAGDVTGAVFPAVTGSRRKARNCCSSTCCRSSASPASSARSASTTCCRSPAWRTAAT